MFGWVIAMSIFVQGFTMTWFRFCYEDDCTKEDPLSQESFRKLAQPLPYSKQHHSKLVCYISKELMDTENPPLVLPNGYVYSTKVFTVPNARFCMSMFVFAGSNCVDILNVVSICRLSKTWQGKIMVKSRARELVWYATIRTLSKRISRNSVIGCW